MRLNSAKEQTTVNTEIKGYLNEMLRIFTDYDREILRLYQIVRTIEGSKNIVNLTDWQQQHLRDVLRIIELNFSRQCSSAEILESIANYHRHLTAYIDFCALKNQGYPKFN